MFLQIRSQKMLSNFLKYPWLSREDLTIYHAMYFMKLDLRIQVVWTQLLLINQYILCVNLVSFRKKFMNYIL